MIASVIGRKRTSVEERDDVRVEGLLEDADGQGRVSARSTEGARVKLNCRRLLGAAAAALGSSKEGEGWGGDRPSSLLVRRLSPTIKCDVSSVCPMEESGRTTKVRDGLS